MELTPFDRLTSSTQLQMLKLMLPYMPPGNQRMLAVYVRFFELQHTLNFFRHSKGTLSAQSLQKEPHSPLDILAEIRPFLTSKDAETIDILLNALNMMHMFSEVKEASDGEEDPLSMMMGMLSPEQQEMFQMYSTMFDETKKGDENDE